VQAARQFKKAGFTLAYDKTYPSAHRPQASAERTRSLRSPIHSSPLSYPPDTIALTEQAQLLKFTRKIFYVGVEHGLSVVQGQVCCQQRRRDGNWRLERQTPGPQGLSRAPQGRTGKEPDRWASPITTQVQVAPAGNREGRQGGPGRCGGEIRSGTFDTIIARSSLKDGLLQEVWSAGQWQNGEFYGSRPTSCGAPRADRAEAAWQ